MNENKNEIPIEAKHIDRKKVYLIIFIISISLITVVICLPKPHDGRLENARLAELTLSNILRAQESYNTKNGIYAPSLSALVDSNFLQNDSFSVITQNGDTADESGYTFKQTNWTDKKWKITAEPIDKNTGTKRYTLDETGKLKVDIVKW